MSISVCEEMIKSNKHNKINLSDFILLLVNLLIIKIKT